MKKNWAVMWVIDIEAENAEAACRIARNGMRDGSLAACFLATDETTARGLEDTVEAAFEAVEIEITD